MARDEFRQAIATVTPSQVQDWLETGAVLLVDVREPREYEAEHIAGALLLPMSSLDPDFFPVLPGRRVVLHCAIGKRSEAAAKMLAAAGRQVAHMAGGMDAWKDAGFETELPLEAPAPARKLVHPGQVLAREYMAPKGLSRAALARESGLSEAALEALIAGARAVDSEMSLRLAQVFATEPGFWMLLQVDYDMGRAERAMAGRLRAAG